MGQEIDGGWNTPLRRCKKGKWQGPDVEVGEASRKPRAPGVCGHLRPYAALPHVRGGMGKTLQSALGSSSGHKTVQVKFLTRYGGKKNDLCL